jgi:hypothetical protein
MPTYTDLILEVHCRMYGGYIRPWHKQPVEILRSRNLEENNKERLYNFMVRLYDYRANLFNFRLGLKTLR